MCMVFCLHLCIIYVPGAYGGQKSVGSLELELEMVRAAIWVLGIKARFSGRAAGALKKSFQPCVKFLSLECL